jgi:Ca-activated chloride channel homolog
MRSTMLPIGLILFLVVGGLTPMGYELTLQQNPVARRPAKSMFQSEPGKPDALELAFDPQTQLVTVTLSVEDPQGYFIPNLRPENFVVSEDGVPQRNATVDVDHAAVSMQMLLEGGGRYQALNQLLSTELPSVAQPLLKALIPEDRVAVSSYANTVKLLADVNEPRSKLDAVLSHVEISGFSEANLYDALIETLKRPHDMPGRRALLVISTGLDSFSHATFNDVVSKARQADTPVYCIGLGGLVQLTIVSSTGPLSKIAWARASTQLETLASVSNGRTYLRDTVLGIPAIYDDLMEHLRVRYVIKYTSGAHGGGSMRRVRVALVDPRTGGPLKISDGEGGAIAARVSAAGSYTPPQ